MHWAKWYKAIYEMLPSDKPADDIIEDDAALDRWFDAFLQDIARREAKAGRGRPGGVDLFGREEHKVETVGG